MNFNSEVLDLICIQTVCKSNQQTTLVGKELTLKAPITTAATSFPIFENNKVWYFKRIVCQQTILMKYHALFIIFEKQQNLKPSSAAYYRWRFKS